MIGIVGWGVVVICGMTYLEWLTAEMCLHVWLLWFMEVRRHWFC